MQGQKNLSHMRSSMCSRPKWPTSLWHPLRATSLCAVGRTSCRRVPFDSLGLAHLYKTPFVVPGYSAPFCTDSIWESLFSWTSLVLASPLLVSLLLCLSRVCFLCLLPVIQGHLGYLLTVLDCPYDMQVIAVSLYGANRLFPPSKAASWIALTAVAVTFRLVLELSAMHSGQDTLDRASASMLVLPAQ